MPAGWNRCLSPLCWQTAWSRGRGCLLHSPAWSPHTPCTGEKDPNHRWASPQNSQFDFQPPSIISESVPIKVWHSLIMLVPLLSPPQVWEQLKGSLRCYPDVHLHLETQHVVFLQRVQPDLRTAHAHKHKHVWTGSVPLLLHPRHRRYRPRYSTHFWPWIFRAYISTGLCNKDGRMSANKLVATIPGFFSAAPRYRVSERTRINKRTDSSCVCLPRHIRNDHQTQHLHCFSLKLIPSWFWHPLASARRHCCSSGTSGKQMAASAAISSKPL